MTTNSLQQRIQTLAHSVLDSEPGAWLVWCDPHGAWAPLLKHAATASGRGGFALVRVSDWTNSELGSPAARAALQARLDAQERFVLLVPAGPDALGWLWAQALRAGRIYASSLRDQLLAWGWQPQTLTLSDDELAVLALQRRLEDPAAWGGGGLQPNVELLLEVLTGSAAPEPEARLVLDLTLTQAGLPPLEEPLPAWRTRVLARLLVTEAHALAPDLIGAGHEGLIPPDGQKLALQLLDRWRDSKQLSKQLPAAILEADKLTGLGAALAQATTHHGPFLSHAAERTIFSTTCRRLLDVPNGDLPAALAGLQSDLLRHVGGFWGEAAPRPQAVAWDELARLSHACARLLAALPPGPWATPAAAMAWYTSGGWQIDAAGEELLRDLAKAPPDLLALIAPLRAAYRARWEHLMLTWSEVWTGADCPVPELPTAGDWLRDMLQDTRPTAILVIDALRYDLGQALAAGVNQQEGQPRATVRPARAPLPSVTALGMGLALPIVENKLEADLVGGQWQLRLAGSTANLSVAAERRKWWQTQGKVAEDALLDLKAVLNDPVPAPGPARARLVIYDATIDKSGHDDQLETMGSGHIRGSYLTAIEYLRQAGWLRILLVTDHGYIHWSGSEEKSITPPLPDPAYQSRRALAYPANASVPPPAGRAPGGRWRIAVAPGAASFRAYGGLGYFHGGASLQEWIIPCVKIEWPVQAQPVQVELQPLANVLGERPRVTLDVRLAGLFAEDGLPREVEVLIRNANSHAILYRSTPRVLKPGDQQAVIEAPGMPGAEAARDTALRIEVRDTHTEEILASQPSTLKTELTGW